MNKYFIDILSNVFTLDKIYLLKELSRNYIKYILINNCANSIIKSRVDLQYNYRFPKTYCESRATYYDFYKGP